MESYELIIVVIVILVVLIIALYAFIKGSILYQDDIDNNKHMRAKYTEFDDWIKESVVDEYMNLYGNEYQFENVRKIVKRKYITFLENKMNIETKRVNIVVRLTVSKVQEMMKLKENHLSKCFSFSKLLKSFYLIKKHLQMI